MTKHLIGLWHFDESDGPLAIDASGHNRPLYTHGATREQGRFGSAMTFRHRFEYARGPWLGALATGTVSLWVRLDGQNHGVTLLGLNEELRIQVEREKGTGFAAVLGTERTLRGQPMRAEIATAVSDQPVDTGRWYHVAVTFGAGGLHLYIDGACVASDMQATHGLSVGWGHEQYMVVGGVYPRFVPFTVDELAIFDAQLAAEQIKQLAASPVEAEPTGSEAPQPRTIDAADFVNPDDPTCGLQDAVDALGPAGGTVVIPTGRYTLRRPLVLSPDTTLTGQGGQSVLVAPEFYEAKLTSDARQGDCAINVEDASAFRVGDEISITSGKMRGWHTTHAIVTGIDGQTIQLNRPLWRDYKVEAAAMAAHWFPMLLALMSHNIRIADLSIEGVARKTDLRPDFTSSAVHLVRCFDCEVVGCRVTSWPHDGVSIQMGARHLVTNCTVRNGGGHGFHPGTGIRESVWSNNIGTGNGVDGFYFCARVRDTIASNSVFAENHRHGIGGLGGGNDRRNLVSANQCVGNHGSGIQMDGGCLNTVVNNVCRANSRTQPGKWPGILLTETRDNVVAGNTCLDDPDHPWQTVGIGERPDASGNVIRDNVCLGCDVDLSGKDTVAEGNTTRPDAKP